MSARSRKRLIGGAVAVIILAFAATVLPMLAVSTSETPRDINIVVRGMAFYVDNGVEANPVITLRAGERVRVRVRNQDAGMRHDFTIKAWTVATKMLDERGEEDAVEFQVPDSRGTQTYQCTPHPKMMTGTVRVE
jgi:plastocyanin